MGAKATRIEPHILGGGIVARVIDAGKRWRCEIPARQRSISAITAGQSHSKTRGDLDNNPVFDRRSHGYNSHERRLPMRSVNVAELKNRLSKYLTFAKGGEEIIIRDRNLPVAKLVPFSPEEGTEEELLFVAAGKMRLPDRPVDLEKVLRIPTGKHLGRAGTQALLEDREQSL
jgi:prevent-host-death family protein